MLQRDAHDRPLTMNHMLLGFRDVQVPLLAMLLLAGSAAKFARVLRVGTVDAGLGPTVLFPMPLRRRVAIAISAVELTCGAALLITAAGAGRGAPTTAARMATTLLFLVAAFALIELRSSHPGTGCGCFGDLSIAPVSGRTLARSALLAGAGLATIGLPPLRLPGSGTDAVLVLAALAAELAVIAALSPELSEALVRLGYSEPCELRRLPAARTLAALRKSAQWRRRGDVLTSDEPTDMWRELCWRYVVYPAQAGGRDAEAVFAVYLRPHRPVIHAALVDVATGTVLDWPAAPQWRGKPARRPWRSRPATSGSPRRAAGWPAGGRLPAPGLPVASSLTASSLGAPSLGAPSLAASGLARAQAASPAGRSAVF